MNILIVDDDAYIIRVIKSQINWTGIGIDHVYTALNASRAKEIIKENPIDIMVTDIEMPQESGLDLMRWILKEGYHPESICLTCHAEFDYARDAISLGYTEYCIKPIEFKELERILANAVIKCNQKMIKRSMETEGELWVKNKRIVVADFWNNIIHGKYTGQVEHIIKLATEKKVDYHFDTEYRCAMFAVCPIQKNETAWKQDKDLMKYALHNILSEKFSEEDRAGMLGWHEDYLWIIIDEHHNIDALEEIEDYRNICSELLGIHLAAYISDKVFGENLGLEFDKLTRLDMDNVRRVAKIYFSNREIVFTDLENQQDNFFADCKKLLDNNEFEEFYKRIVNYIINRENWNRELLEGFLYNIIQLLSSRLQEMNILADKLFDRDMIQTMRNANKSINETIKCLEQLKNKMCQLSETNKQELKIINDIKEYIHMNIESKLTRKEIADQIFLSPDHLTKLFRKETGMTLIEYVMEEKVNVAKKMISQENIPIGEVAGRLGYENFSYFSEIFRKKTGKSPSEYKRITE